MKTILLFIVATIVGCSGSGSSGSSEEEDLTCWAHSAADIINVHELDYGFDVYKELVDEFGNRIFSVADALSWWVDINSIEGWDILTLREDFMGEADILFSQGAKAMAFLIPWNKKYKHYLTAYKTSDLEGYDILVIVYMIEE